MDPNECLKRIIESVKKCYKFKTPAECDSQEYRDILKDIDEGMEDLAEWLDKDGFAPVATGPVFGEHEINVGEVWQGKTKKVVRKNILSSTKRFAILTVGSDDHRWMMRRYDSRGNTVRTWEFYTE